MTAVGAGLRPAPGQVTDLPLPRIQSLAVLPLENLSGDPEQEYFADGMTEALIAELGQISALRVISRTSVMRYKGAKKPLPEIARELNVDGIVEGTVVRSENRVRINAQLMQAHPEKHLWAASYERDLRDVLALQSEVAWAIAREIKIAVTPEEQKRLASSHPVNPAAHEAYLRGRYLHQQVFAGTETRRKALQYFQEAIGIDPTYAPAYAGAADAYSRIAGHGELRPREAYPKARAAVSKALEIDKTLPEAHVTLGRIKLMFDWDWEGAERELRHAIELNTNYAPAYGSYALYFRAMGRPEEDLANLKRARELDPPAWPGEPLPLPHYWICRQYEKLIDLSRKLLDLEPNDTVAHVFLGCVYVQKGMSEEAVSVFQKALELSPGSQMIKSQLARAYAEGGQTAEARRILRELEDLYEREYASPFFIAIVYVGLGEKDKAFEWLEKAYEERCDDMLWLRSDPWLDPLRSDPRFQDLLRRMNFPP